MEERWSASMWLQMHLILSHGSAKIYMEKCPQPLQAHAEGFHQKERKKTDAVLTSMSDQVCKTEKLVIQIGEVIIVKETPINEWITHVTDRESKKLAAGACVAEMAITYRAVIISDYEDIGGGIRVGEETGSWIWRWIRAWRDDRSAKRIGFRGRWSDSGPCWRIESTDSVCWKRKGGVLRIIDSTRRRNEGTKDVLRDVVNVMRTLTSVGRGAKHVIYWSCRCSSQLCIWSRIIVSEAPLIFYPVIFVRKDAADRKDGDLQYFWGRYYSWVGGEKLKYLDAVLGYKTLLMFWTSIKDMYKSPIALSTARVFLFKFTTVQESLTSMYICSGVSLTLSVPLFTEVAPNLGYLPEMVHLL